jgi:hypothetical protein
MSNALEQFGLAFTRGLGKLSGNVADVFDVINPTKYLLSENTRHNFNQAIANVLDSAGNSFGNGFNDTATQAVKDSLAPFAGHHLDTVSQAASHLNPLAGAAIAVGGAAAALGLNAVAKNRASIASALNGSVKKTAPVLRTAVPKI